MYVQLLNIFKFYQHFCSQKYGRIKHDEIIRRKLTIIVFGDSVKKQNT